MMFNPRNLQSMSQTGGIPGIGGSGSETGSLNPNPNTSSNTSSSNPQNYNAFQGLNIGK